MQPRTPNKPDKLSFPATPDLSLLAQQKTASAEGADAAKTEKTRKPLFSKEDLEKMRRDHSEIKALIGEINSKLDPFMLKVEAEAAERQAHNPQGKKDQLTQNPHTHFQREKKKEPPTKKEPKNSLKP